ncbi:NERD domain-containing protein [Nocardioides sp. AE5]|uniref:nuclease-related domain-containing DEAD/DEAH box helicase n=1 Tax=Nocardioides sp. AE5 TaxID=2962573 RepID=UPI002882B474|nr:NERD domain-containing protein [Nocardioides sp. AE5]MDT0203803.1 NERD domain-containing protein [Nocardioides sp. AE5]
MPARTFPAEPKFVNGAEREVFETLRDGLGDDDVVIANLRLTDEAKDHEADFVVLMPGIGIAVLEVKGGSVWFDAEGWKQRRGGGEVRIDPVEQVRTTKYAIRSYVAADERWGRRNHVAWGHGLVTPHAEFGNDFTVPELPRWALHDRTEMAGLGGRLREMTWGLAQGKTPPTYDEVELILEILQGRKHTAYDVNADSDARAADAERLTQDQLMLLKVTRLLNRVEVRGGAGSGKTVLALAQAKELTRSGKRVAVLCYSLGLAAWMRREVATWHRRSRPAFAGTFHSFGIQWGAPADAPRTDSDFWEHTLPTRMDELADGLADRDRYDAVIVDEAQDFAESWWSPVLKALRDEEESGLYVYSDENQRIFARFGRPPVPLVPLVLDHNLRNTRQIHEAFGPLAPSRMYSRGGDGPEVRFIPAAADGAVAAADDAIDALLEEGWRPENVALLTTGHRHPVQVERTTHRSQEEYWETWWDDGDVFFGHVLGCKGLERRVVVLCVNESTVRERSRERLYVGMSRATDLLVVVGDPGVIREMGGDQVAARLGL